MLSTVEEVVEHPLTPEDVAVLLQIDRETVYRMARRGDLPAFKVSKPLALPALPAAALDGGARTPGPLAPVPECSTVGGSGRRTPGAFRGSSI